MQGLQKTAGITDKRKQCIVINLMERFEYIQKRSRN